MDSEQSNNRPWLYKKGQSGNPKGRPVGSKSMKTYIKEKLAAMTDEEREEFLEGVDKKIIWEMGEGKAKQDVDVEHKATLVVRFDDAFDSETPPETKGNSTEESTV